MTPSRIARDLVASAATASLLLLGSGCGAPLAPVEEKETAEASLRAVPGGRASAVAMSAHTIHREEGGLLCADCHTPHNPMMPGPLFRWSPKAYIPGGPPPTLDAATHTCSTVACHMVPVGTYQYWKLVGDDEWLLYEATYGGPVRTAPWGEALRGACRACHASPPSPAAGAWHSPTHGGGGINAECSLCHPNVSKVNGELVISGQGHKNGVVDVTPQWKSRCFGCH
jgi:hypothetical protein